MKLPKHYYRNGCYWAHMVTFRCGANCPFCIISGRGKRRDANELTGKQILNFWNGLKHPAAKKLSLIGGEPTLHPDIVEIINNLEGYKITMTTNCKSPFYDDDNFASKFKTKAGTSLRINSSFHPHYTEPEEYVRVIKKYQEAGHFVDQKAFVMTPEAHKYFDKIAKVEKSIKLSCFPYLGFYKEGIGFDCEPRLVNLYPKAQRPDNNERCNNCHNKNNCAAKICRITDFAAYKDMCGAGQRRRAECYHPPKVLMVGPGGRLYHCHFKMYYGYDHIGHVSNFKPIKNEPVTCDYYGYCNWCDVPRAGCKKNSTAREIV